jgi:hypothetical protein
MGLYSAPGCLFRDETMAFFASLVLSPSLLDLLFGLRQLLDISGGILEGDELASLAQRNRFVETSLPSFVRLQ